MEYGRDLRVTTALTRAGMAWGCDLSYDYVKINAEYTT
jgi:N-acetylglutamate synthase/N-acetylornithine aminotransferase